MLTWVPDEVRSGIGIIQARKMRSNNRSALIRRVYVVSVCHRTSPHLPACSVCVCVCVCVVLLFRNCHRRHSAEHITPGNHYFASVMHCTGRYYCSPTNVHTTGPKGLETYDWAKAAGLSGFETFWHRCNTALRSKDDGFEWPEGVTFVDYPADTGNKDFKVYKP